MWRGKAIEKMLNAIRTKPHSLELTRRCLATVPLHLVRNLGRRKSINRFLEKLAVRGRTLPADISSIRQVLRCKLFETDALSAETSKLLQRHSTSEFSPLL